jgi:pimeloyl-ACP methyl ester carboxylesterase
VKLHTSRRGTGPLLVCHPGGPGFGGGELHDLGGLDRHRTLLLVDPRGAGRSPRAASYLLADYVADLEELRGDLDLEAFDLLGFSHGGLVAAAYAVTHPLRVRRLVLAGSLAAFTEAMQAETTRFLAGRAHQPWHPAAVAALEREERGVYRTPEETAAMWNDMAPLSFSTWEERYRSLVEAERLEPEPLRALNATPFDLRPELRRVEAETLVITGRDDFVCGPAAAADLAAGIPGARLVLLDGAGHFAFLERPDAFRAAVEAFLSG